MASKKTMKRGHKKKTSSPKGRKFPAILILIICVCVVAMGSLLLFKIYTGKGDQKKSVSSETLPVASEPSKVSTDDLQRLMGRWLRPDGGYVIDIRQVGSDGKMQAAYYNPRPINISQAQAKGQGVDIHIFIELRDEGYPGATYDLTYNRQKDTLVGSYYQPTAGQRFEVVFLRMP